MNFITILAFYPPNKRDLLDFLIINPLKEIFPGYIEKIQVIPQIGTDIGSRFTNVFKHAFFNLNLNSVIIVGSDTPHLQPSLLDRSIKLLEEDPNNAILGPSQNGGFYLLGHNKPFIQNIGSIFNDLSSSTELVRAMELLAKKNKVHIFPEVTDIDTFENLNTVRNIIKILSISKSTYSESISYYFPLFTSAILAKVDETIWMNHKQSKIPYNTFK